MAQQTILDIIMIYWIVTTLFGAYWMAKNRCQEVWEEEKPKHFTLFEVAGRLFPSMLASWILIPIYLLTLVKFKK